MTTECYRRGESIEFSEDYVSPRTGKMYPLDVDLAGEIIGLIDVFKDRIGYKVDILRIYLLTLVT
jgi:hypothetical protein